MPLDVREIAAGDEDNTCAPVAVVNLFRLRGIAPPPLDTLEAKFKALAAAAEVAPEVMTRTTGRTRADEGPTMFEIEAVVSEGGRLLTSLCRIPPALHHNPRPVFEHFLDAGCHLLVAYSLWDANAGEGASHIVVAEGYDAAGMSVLDGNFGWLDGTTIELMPPALTEGEWAGLEKWCETNSHGSRRVLPYYPVASPPARPFGILPQFIVAHPAGTLEGMMSAAAAERAEKVAAARKAGGAGLLRRMGEAASRSESRSFASRPLGGR